MTTLSTESPPPLSLMSSRCGPGALTRLTLTSELGVLCSWGHLGLVCPSGSMGFGEGPVTEQHLRKGWGTNATLQCVFVPKVLPHDREPAAQQWPLAWGHMRLKTVTYGDFSPRKPGLSLKEAEVR